MGAGGNTWEAYDCIAVCVIFRQLDGAENVIDRQRNLYNWNRSSLAN